MKIAILGDSSVACLKEAVANDHTLTKDNDLSFFAGPSLTMAGLHVEGAALVPDNDKLRDFLRTTSGLQTIKLSGDAFDAFVVVGMGIDLRPLPKNAYSRAVLEAAYRGLVTTSLAWILIERLRQITQGPIYCVAAPLKALSADNFQKLYPTPCIAYAEMANDHATVLQERGVDFFLQPEETRDADWRTQDRFARGSTRLIQGTAHPKEDVTHMNADYGAVIMPALLRSIAR
jgi:hypothetical protein